MRATRLLVAIGPVLVFFTGCAEPPTHGTGDMINVLVAKHDLDEGKILTTEDITIEKLPKKWLPEDLANLLIAKHDLEKGKKTTAGDTVNQRFPNRLIPSSMKDDVLFARDRIAIEGLWWGKDIREGQVITWRDLSSRPPGAHPSSEPDKGR
jgi:Flp pilus assembly protein CpaB